MLVSGSAPGAASCASCNGAELAFRRDDVAPSPLPPPGPSSGTSDAHDECEAMLRRAIAMVREADRSRSGAIASNGGLRPFAAAIPPMSASAIAAGNDGGDETEQCATLLARAIAMIRGR